MRVHACIRVVCLAGWLVYPDENLYKSRAVPLTLIIASSVHLIITIFTPQKSPTSSSLSTAFALKENKIQTTTTMQFSNIIQAILLLGATPALVNAANCNPGANNWGVSTSQYQQAASAICNGGTDVETFFGSVGGGTGRYVKSWFNGSKGSRSQCWVSRRHFLYRKSGIVLRSTWKEKEDQKLTNRCAAFRMHSIISSANVPNRRTVTAGRGIGLSTATSSTMACSPTIGRCKTAKRAQAP